MERTIHRSVDSERRYGLILNFTKKQTQNSFKIRGLAEEICTFPMRTLCESNLFFDFSANSK